MCLLRAEENFQGFTVRAKPSSSARPSEATVSRCSQEVAPHPSLALPAHAPHLSDGQVTTDNPPGRAAAAGAATAAAAVGVGAGRQVATPRRAKVRQLALPAAGGRRAA